LSAVGLDIFGFVGILGDNYHFSQGDFMTRNPNMGRPVLNKHKVPKAQWDAWSNHARKVFNTMYYNLRPTMQFVFLHPEMPALSKRMWETTRWNVAWEAAEQVDGKGPIKRVVKAKA